MVIVDELGEQIGIQGACEILNQEVNHFGYSPI